MWMRQRLNVVPARIRALTAPKTMEVGADRVQRNALEQNMDEYPKTRV